MAAEVSLTNNNLEMSETVIRVAYEGNREKIRLANPTLSALEQDVKTTFSLKDVDLVARLKDGIECDLRDEGELSQNINNLDYVLVYEYLKNPLEIVLGKETHALDVIPNSDTILIRYVKESVITPEFNLPSFVDRLGDTANYVRLSYYHLLACDQNEMANDVDNLAIEVLKPLMEHCKETFDSFVTSTREMLQMIQRMFEYARDGVDLHDQARESGKYLVEKAVAMKIKAENRVEELKEAKKEMKKVVAEVLGEKATKGNAETVYRKKLEKANDKLVRLRRVIQECDDAKEREKIAERKVREHVRRHSRVYWWVAWVLDFDSYRMREQLELAKSDSHREYTKACDDAKGAEREKREIEAKMAAYVSEQAELIKILGYLTEASKSIKQARMVVQEMQTFWRKMEGAGESLAGDKSFLESTEKAVGGDREARRLRQSRGYKKQAINYIARIVGIRDISADCSKQLNRVGEDIDAILIDTPTREEALAKLDELANTERPRANTSEYGLEGSDAETRREIAEMFTLSHQPSDYGRSACVQRDIGDVSTQASD